jgi:hypothetical protein
MSKKIAMTTRPQAAVSPQADKWVSDQPPAAEPAGPTKRLTVDVPENNHTRFKVLCAMQRRKMAEEVNAFIAHRIAEAEQQGRAS